MRKWLKASLFIVGLLLLIGLSIQVYTKRNAEKNGLMLSQFASIFGYKQEDKLAEYSTCWEILSSECGRVLYFQTNLNKSEVQSLIDKISSEKKLPKNIDGYSIYAVNQVTDYSLTINNTKDRLKISEILEPLAYSWWVTVEGSDWTVTIYLTEDDGNIYKFEDKILTQNVMTIMLDTK